MNPSLAAEAVVGAGRGALIEAIFGAAWLGWGLGVAGAFDKHSVGPALGLLELFLLACSIHVIRKGRRLRKRFPPLPASLRKTMLKSYLLVVFWEALAIFCAWILSTLLHRPDLGADWYAMVVGAHFLPLARIFRSPHLGVIGILIVSWCVLCWTLFRSSDLVISVTLGTGTLLWGAALSALYNARKIAHSIDQVQEF